MTRFLKSRRAVPAGSEHRSASSFKQYIARLWHFIWRGSFWRKLMVVLAIIVLLFVSAMYGVGQWYIRKHKNEPLILGTSFITQYAQTFGLEPKQTLEAILSDLNIKQLRLVSYWDQLEPQEGQYDFSGLDWQFDLADKYNAKVSLAIGLRQPRWPECRAPSWAANMPKSQWQPRLYKFITEVINHYKNNPALDDYELENEFLLNVFGKCTDFDRQRLIEEYQLVKKLDPNHKVIISRSNNWVGLPVGQPTPDQFAVSVYKRVWDYAHTNRYVEYPLPPWFYAALAGGGELISGKDMIIHELQAEPWPPPPNNLVDTPLKEQFKSLTPQRLKDRIDFGIDTGMRTIDLWGAEWWYWMKVKNNDPSFWNIVKQAVADAEAANLKLQNSKSR